MVLFQSIVGLPWDPVPGLAVREDHAVPVVTLKVVADSVVADAGLPPALRRVEPPTKRRLYVYSKRLRVSTLCFYRWLYWV